MKKILSAACTLLLLAACKNDDNPAYYTPPSIGSITCTPKIDAVTPDDNVIVRAEIRNAYGSAQACVKYRTGSDIESADKAKEQRTELVKVSEGSPCYFKAEIPQQEAGRCVIFYIYCLNIYGVDAASAEYVYTVAGKQP